MPTFSQNRCVALSGLAALFVIACALQLPTAAKPANPSGEGQSERPHAQVELIADWSRASVADKTIWTGVLFDMDPGWHIYWENAGDSGTPPEINWHLPGGYRAGAIRWPTPVRLGHGSVVDYGYEGEVLLMVPIERGRAQGPEARARKEADGISAEVNYVVCRDICVPGRAHLNLAPLEGAGWPADGARWRAIFRRTRAQLPRPRPASWKVSARSSKDDFVLSIETRTAVQGAAFFPLDAGEIENSAPQAFTRTPGGFRLRLRKSEQLAAPVTSLQGLLVLGPGRAFQVSLPVATR